MNFVYYKDYGSYKSVLCPYHDDTNFGNAFVYFENNVWNFKCFACGKFIRNVYNMNLNYVPKQTKNKFININDYPYANENLSYLYNRGITKDNILEFNIRLYNYKTILIPIKNDIIEFRNIINTKPKVYYSKKFNKDFLFNFEKANKKYVYVKEGITGIFKIYNHITKSVVSTLGANLTNDQLKLFEYFNEIYLNPDLDKAGLNMILKFFPYHKKTKIIISKDDKEKDYLDSFHIVNYFEALYLFRSKF